MLKEDKCLSHIDGTGKLQGYFATKQSPDTKLDVSLRRSKAIREENIVREHASSASA